MKKIQELGKIPPQAVNLEEQLLGSLLAYPRFEYAYKTVNSKHFYKEEHMIIFEAMERLHKQKEQIILSSVVEELKSSDNLEQVGGPYFLSQLESTGIPSTYQIDFCAKIIVQKYIARSIIQITATAQDKAFDSNIDVEEVIEGLYSDIERLSNVNHINYPKIMHYERIVLKNCVYDNESLLNLMGNIPDYFFIDPVHQVIWNIMIMLQDTNVPVNINSVADVLEESENKKHVPYFKQIIEYDYGKEERSFEYLVQYLKKNYDRTQIFKLYRYLERARVNSPPEAIVEKIENVLESIRVKDLDIYTHQSLLDKTLTDIISKHQEGNFSVIKTGYPYMDFFCKFSNRNIVMLGGARGHGKTRVAIKIILGILQNDDDTAAFLVTMEDPAVKVQKLLIAALTGLTVDQIDSNDYKLSEEERKQIKEAIARIKNYDLAYIDQPISSAHAEAAFVKFSKKRPGKKIILLLDNVMALTDNDSKVTTEDMISKRFMSIVHKTNGLLFVLHHFTKEQANKASLEEAFRPKEEHLKGSTRFLDVAHYVLLMNLPKKYNDFMLMQRKKPMISYKGKKMDRITILNNLLIIEVSKHRDGSNDEDKRILRFYPIDLGTMQIEEWK